jgi:phage recombination protein Bet
MNAVVKIDGKPSLLATMAARYGVDPDRMHQTLTATAFKGNVSPEQLMALCIVANQYGLNPFTKEIYAFPDRNNGIVPVVGVDGWSRIINEHPQCNGIQFTEADDGSWIECTIHRKDREFPTAVREYLTEVKRDNSPAWKSHPRRMLRHKALIQCARIAFGFGGIYDQDEAERIIDVTPVLTANPRDGLEAADPLKVDEYVARISEIVEADVEEEPRADMIFDLHQEINALGAGMYSAVYDAMASRKVLTKKGWDTYKAQGSKQFQQRNAEARK